jgi:hypothetical protein
MATFAALKHDRVLHLLEDVPVERIFAITPIREVDDNRGEVTRYLAESFVQRYGGETFDCHVLDHDSTFRLLERLHRRYALADGCNFEIALTGTKLQTVGAAMLGAVAAPAAVHYCVPGRFAPDEFGHGGGATRVVQLRRIEGKETAP